MPDIGGINVTMDPFFNPVFLGRVLSSYLFDVDRVWKMNNKQMKKYQDREFRRIVNYAYTVPMYHKKYRACGVHPQDIRGIDDIEKLPFITKNDLRENYPDNIIPNGFDKKNGFLISTSGSTGKPVFVYYDLLSAIKSLECFVRGLKAYGGNWRKTRIVLIVDISPGSAEHAVFTKSALTLLKKFITLENIKYLHIGEKPEVILKEVNEFNPEFLGSYPEMLRSLAFLKKSGYGKDITPKYVLSSGAMLDSYTKNYVEDAFGTRVLDYYGTTEAGPLAFECLEGNYHIHSDFVNLEFLDDDNKPVAYGEPGHTIVTKLYGQGTPIIRYTGIDDIAIPIDDKCSCGINTQIIRKIEGRSTDLILLPSGKTLSPLSITGIPAKVMEDLNTYKIEQFQIIQHKVDEIEVLIVINKKTRNVGPPVEKILSELRKKFQEKIGPDVKIFVKEVEEIYKNKPSDKVKVVISKVKSGK